VSSGKPSSLLGPSVLLSPRAKHQPLLCRALGRSGDAWKTKCSSGLCTEEKNTGEFAAWFLCAHPARPEHPEPRLLAQAPDHCLELLLKLAHPAAGVEAVLPSPHPCNCEKRTGSACATCRLQLQPGGLVGGSGWGGASFWNLAMSLF
jgi:hypothetical protein